MTDDLRRVTVRLPDSLLQRLEHLKADRVIRTVQEGITKAIIEWLNRVMD